MITVYLDVRRGLMDLCFTEVIPQQLYPFVICSIKSPGTPGSPIQEGEDNFALLSNLIPDIF